MSLFSKILLLGKLKLNSLQLNYLRKKHPLNYLFWEATLNCNFNCRHCGSRASRQNHFNDELTTEEIKSVFKSISLKTNPQKIMLAITGGEPLLRKDLFDVMDYANKLGFNWGMVTNGYLISPKIVEQMKKSGMSTIVVSIDGIGKKHDEFRQTPGSYEKAINAVKLLVKFGFVKNVQITTVINQNNINDLEEMYQEFSKLHLHSWRIVNMDPIGRAQDNKKLLLKPTEFKKMVSFIKEKRPISKMDITYSCSGFLGPKYEGKVRNWLFNCLTGITTASILHNGDIFVCPNVSRMPELIQGNIRKNDFYCTWQNKFKIFRQKNRTSCSNCKKCSEWENCYGGPFHLWDFDKNQPKICHLKYLK
jgi:radical SAM protein with 4Fe4S-binding SPASM domain